LYAYSGPPTATDGSRPVPKEFRLADRQSLGRLANGAWGRGRYLQGWKSAAQAKPGAFQYVYECAG